MLKSSFSSGGDEDYHCTKTNSCQMMSKREQKRRPKPKDGKVLSCGVCGDRALGYNFDAISCESCKAFFRRNALKVKPFVCSFEGNCALDAHSRKFCSGCRLQKCFNIGMKKEWILDANQLQQRRQRQQDRRLHHQYPGSSETNMCTSTFEDPLYDEGAMRVSSHPSSNPCQSTSDSMDKGLTQSTSQIHLTPPHIPCLPPSQSLSLSYMSSDSHSPSSTTGHSYCSAPPTYPSVQLPILKTDSYDSSDTDFNEEKYCHPSESPALMDRLHPHHKLNPAQSDQFLPPQTLSLKREVPDDVEDGEEYDIKPLNPYIRESLEELCQRYRDIFEKPYTEEDVPKLLKTPKTVDQLYNMTDVFIRRLIRFTKFIPEFKSLCQDDQIGILKGGIMELFVLRSCMSFDPRMDSFKFQAQVKTDEGEVLKESGVNKSVLNTIGSSMFKGHMTLIHDLQDLTKQDYTILVLVFIIQLMTPYRPNVKNNNLLTEAQDRHLTWLQAYIRSQYDGPKSALLFSRLMEKMTEVQVLGKASCQLLVNIDVKRLEPILVEIFNLNS